MVAVALLLGLAACGGADEVTIDSGQPQARPTTTTSTTEPEDDDDDDDRGRGRNDEKISCDDDSAPSLDQVGGKVEITGNCDEVSVDGITLKVKIESTERLLVQGIGLDVEVTDSVDVVEVHGVNHEIKVPEGTEVDDQSRNSDIHD